MTCHRQLQGAKIQKSDHVRKLSNADLCKPIYKVTELKERGRFHADKPLLPVPSPTTFIKMVHDVHMPLSAIHTVHLSICRKNN